MTDDEDLVKEIHSATIPRVDAVDGPAHGLSFMILKALDPSPAVAKVKYTAEQQRDMLARGEAMKGPDGQPSYPIGDRADLEAAVHAVGRGTAGHDDIRRFILRRAKALDAMNVIPDNWAADGSLKKAANMDDDLDLTAPADEIMDTADDDLAAADAVPSESPGDPDDPGSPAWEAVDAARARGAVQQLSELKDLLCAMAEREEQEAVSGHPGDTDSAMDLASAKDAVDYALSILAKFAVDEQSEADNGAQDAEDAARALGLIKALEAVDGPVAKAGRVLSARNEQTLTTAREAMTSAVEAITSVLGQVAPVEKNQEAAVADDNTTESVTKADDLSGTSDADLKRMVLTGSTSDRNKALMELGLRTMTGDTGSGSDTDDSQEAAVADTPDTTDDTTTDAAPAADDTAAAPAAAPTDDQAATPTDDESDGVAKGLEDPDKTEADPIAKALSDAMSKIAELEQRLVKVESTPVDDGPFMAGVIPGTPGLHTRGQDTESDTLAGLRKQLDETTDPTARAGLQGAIAMQMVKDTWAGGR